MSEITTAFALLAPVPQVHLEDGLQCHPKVAFGSRAGAVFAEADFCRKAERVRVFIYESLSNRPTQPPKVSWTGVYIGQVPAVGKDKRHPQGNLYRPERAFTKDTPGHWLIYWEVEELEYLPNEADRIKISDLRGLANPTSPSSRLKPHYARNFVPEGPLLIEYPSQNRV
jgi:hypothetical protein